jgi:hypothetical protein
LEMALLSVGLGAVLFAPNRRFMMVVGDVGSRPERRDLRARWEDRRGVCWQCGVNGRHRTMVVAPAVPANVIDRHVGASDLLTLRFPSRIAIGRDVACHGNCRH